LLFAPAPVLESPGRDPATAAAAYRNLEWF
jgi:hypothetical protein